MKIYKPCISYYYKEELEKFKKGSTIRMSSVFFKKEFYSCKNKCLSNIKKKLKEFTDDMILCSISIENHYVDKESRYKDVFYNKKLKKIGFTSWNKDFKHKKNRYQLGEWIIYISGNDLQIGKIGARAKGEEPFYVVHEANYINDCSPHNHTPEFLIVESISEGEAKKLLPRKYFENIKLRYNSFLDYRKRIKKARKLKSKLYNSPQEDDLLL